MCELAGNEKEQRLAAPDQQVEEQLHVAGPRLGGHTYGLAPDQAVGNNFWEWVTTGSKGNIQKMKGRYSKTTPLSSFSVFEPYDFKTIDTGFYL